MATDTLHSDISNAHQFGIIVRFAAMLAEADGPSHASQTAIDHGWLDHDGAPTEIGRTLVHALTEQSGARSVFRGF